MAAIELGAGRKIKEDKIDPKAGIIFNYKIGERINKGSIIAELFSDSKSGIEIAKQRIEKSFRVTKVKPNKIDLIKKVFN